MGKGFMWWFLLVSDMMIPIVIAVFGKMLEIAPGTKNAYFGYRTKRSMSSQEAWNYSNRYCGRLMFYLGVIMAGITLILFLTIVRGSDDTVGWIGGGIALVQCACIFIPVVLTEKELKKRFDEEGRPLKQKE